MYWISTQQFTAGADLFLEYSTFADEMYLYYTGDCFVFILYTRYATD